MRRLNTLILSTITAAALTGSAALAAERWNIATPYPESNFDTQNVYYFAEQVKDLTSGEIEVLVHSGGSLYKHPEIMRAVGSGQIELGSVNLSIHGNENALFEADAIPFLARGFEEARQLYALQKAGLEELLEESGSILLFSSPWPGVGVYTESEVSSTSDLRGLKIRSYNTPISRFVEHLDATPATVQQVEVPQAFSTGVIEAMPSSPNTGVDTAAWDYVDHFLNLEAWHNKLFVIMNEEKFESLSAATKEAILTAAERAEEWSWQNNVKEGERAIETLASHGIKVKMPSEELESEFQAVGQVMIDEWVARAGPIGAQIAAEMGKQ